MTPVIHPAPFLPGQYVIRENGALLRHPDMMPVLFDSQEAAEKRVAEILEERS